MKTCFILGCYLIGSFISTTSSTENRLGHQDINNHTSNGLFQDLDADKNGDISFEEIREYVADTGGIALDEKDEIQNAVENVLSGLDGNEDNVVTLDELSQHWDALGSLLTTDEVVAWAEHSIQLPPHIVAKFAEHAITGYDFKYLLEKKGLALATQLGIKEPLFKKKIMGHLRQKLFHMSSSPTSPNGITATPQSCSSIMIKWDDTRNVQRILPFPVHKYIVQRLETSRPVVKSQSAIAYIWSLLKNVVVRDDNSANLASSPYKARWITVYDGIQPVFEDFGLSKEVTYR